MHERISYEINGTVDTITRNSYDILTPFLNYLLVGFFVKSALGFNEEYRDRKRESRKKLYRFLRLWLL